jgi:hypothetical protein
MQNESTNEAKHTPGPWHFETALMEKADHLNVWEVNGIGHVAAVSKGLTPDPSAEANARLIAAAPELLESLIDALGWLESAIDCEADLSGIEAAIAKATGRATP